jgi:hypothetical protein
MPAPWLVGPPSQQSKENLPIYPEMRYRPAARLAG